jgi:biopolymer transport protein ExbB/TolQ
MNDTTQNVNVGLVGSLTMTFLCLAVALLCVSFYRRYKRVQKRQDDLNN